MSNFTRGIDFMRFKSHWRGDEFLKRIDVELIRNGKALLTFRNEGATVYYNGNRMCSLAPSYFEPKVNDLFLPLLRSRRMDYNTQERYITEHEWIKDTRLNDTDYSFADVLPEILSNITYHQTKESFQITGLYPYSPLNITNASPIILLDIEATFSATGESTDRIDVVLYHTGERHLIFVEVKGLWDDRLKSKNGNTAEILFQMENYQKRIDDEQDNIKTQYNRVIEYYSNLSGKNIPLIGDKIPLLGLLLVGYQNNDKDSQKRKEVKTLLRSKNIKFKDIGDTANITEKTLLDLYDKFKK